MSQELSQAAFEVEYRRIGVTPGERWPTPANVTDPALLLALLRRVPDGAGLAGWREVLRTAPETASGSGAA